jgi:small subunit ribosomal protein S20
MPHSRSAKKRMNQNEVSRQRNKSAKSAMRTQIKKVKGAIEKGDAAAAEKELQAAMKKLDKAAKSNIIHKNQAARRKSRLQKQVNAAKSK